MNCKWCGVERDAPAVGPHVCDPERVRSIALQDAIDALEKRAAYGEGLLPELQAIGHTETASVVAEQVSTIRSMCIADVRALLLST